jgi:hypothetical protein
MVVHSDSDLGALFAALLGLAALIALGSAVALAVKRRFKTALRVAGITLAAMLGWIAICDFDIVRFTTDRRESRRRLL